VKARLKFPAGARIGGLALALISLIGCDSGRREDAMVDRGLVVSGTPDDADYIFGRDRHLTLAAARAARPIYRHSVIPGGAYSVQELVKATEDDPVVFAQYGSAVQDKPVRIASSPRPRRVYMSYRIGDQIYWTKRKALLTAGETTLTNGDIEIRARCGNQISETEMFPVAENEPDAVEFDNLVADEPALLASNSEVGSTPGALLSATPPAIWATVPAIPFGVPGGGGGSYAPGVPGGPGGGSFSPGVPATGPGPTPSGSLPPPPSPPVTTPPPTSGGPPDGERPQPPGPPFDPPGPPFDPPGPPFNPPGPPLDPYVPPFVPDDNPPTPDDEVPTPTPVPEPGTFVLLGSAVAGLIGMRLRQRARKGANTPPAG
jgi:hypothetical protein